MGSVSNRPSDPSEVVNISTGAKIGAPTFVTGQLPSRSASLSTSQRNTYSCLWGFQQVFLNPGSDMPAHGEAFAGGTEIEDFSLVGTPGYPSAVRLVQGSNGVQWIKSVASTTSLDKSDDQAFLKQRSPDGTEDQTGYVSTGLWQHFPKGGFAEDSGRRHPLTVCRTSGPCPG